MIKITPELVEKDAISDGSLRILQKDEYTKQTVRLAFTLSRDEIRDYLKFGRELDLPKSGENYTFFLKRLEVMQERLIKDFGSSLEDSLE
ncbi:hypothetical protein K8R33_04705 [archaeon]|nr:hypothetical protein [archaeon]